MTIESLLASLKEKHSAIVNQLAEYRSRPMSTANNAWIYTLSQEEREIRAAIEIIIKHGTED
jgi:hypothetical protein